MNAICQRFLAVSLGVQVRFFRFQEDAVLSLYAKETLLIGAVEFDHIAVSYTHLVEAPPMEPRSSESQSA